jgi:hypothetical protein
MVGGLRGRFTGPGDVASLDEALAGLQHQITAGYRTFCFKPSMFTDELDGVVDVCRSVVRGLSSY